MRAPLLLLPIVLTFSACAGQRSSAPVTAAPPASPAEARAELNRLGAEIQRHRTSLGLPPSQVATGVATAAADGAPDAAAQPSPAPPEPGASPELESVQRSSEAADRRPLTRAESDDAEESSYSPPPCSASCRLSAAICRAARRICDLADYLKEPAARGRCARARVDCDEARNKSGRCPSRCR